MLGVYCVDIIGMNNLPLKFVFFIVVLAIFYRYTDAFLLCIFDHILEFDIL